MSNIQQEQDVLQAGVFLIALATVLVLAVGGVAWAAALLAHAEATLDSAPSITTLSPPSKALFDPTLIDHDRGASRLALEDRRHLESYGWVDREHGIVRIPIHRAMELVILGHFPAEQGLEMHH